MNPFAPAEPLHRLKLHRLKTGTDRLAAGRSVPTNVEFARTLSSEERSRFGPILRKPTRTLSGVAVVAVMTAPARCPHGRCTYCPGGLEQRSPQSYTGEEPSALRAHQFGWDARAITAHRLATLEALGHSTSKVEVIVQGGTFPSRPWAHQEEVYRGIFDGLNGTRSASLPEAQRLNETAARRLVGLTVETRPDWCDGRILPELLAAGVTRVEIGVECLRDPVLEQVGRAHRTEEVFRASREARDRGLKLCYHLMLGLPGMDPTRDLEDFKRVVTDPALCPDMLKLYPTLVLPDTGLYEEWKQGRYAPYDTPTAVGLLAKMKRLLPPWVRIQRIQRDIPARLIAAGVRHGNIRQMALAELARTNSRCRCLRCREVGRRPVAEGAEFRPVERRYPASGGEEWFLSEEEPESDAVSGFLRLRFPSAETPGGLAAPVVRELKVLGPEVAIGLRPVGPSASGQHRGLGGRLLGRAASIAAEAGFDRLYVMSAVGTREYYRRFGFLPEGPLMVAALARGGWAAAPAPRKP
ncbi:MAG: tRNA uridine(34) 5-carboxymethylaminomethyl modification radical SAM/GNAT enzyme Elp3 [Thermoplasmata archaeon]